MNCPSVASNAAVDDDVVSGGAARRALPIGVVAADDVDAVEHHDLLVVDARLHVDEAQRVARRLRDAPVDRLARLDHGAARGVVDGGGRRLGHEDALARRRRRCRRSCRLCSCRRARRCADGGAQVLVQPPAPLQVRVPLHAPVGVWMSQATVMPVFAGVAVARARVGTHCLTVPMSPIGDVLAAEAARAGDLLQSRPQKWPPTGDRQAQSCPPTRALASLRARRAELRRVRHAHVVTAPGSIGAGDAETAVAGGTRSRRRDRCTRRRCRRRCRCRSCTRLLSSQVSPKPSSAPSPDQRRRQRRIRHVGVAVAADAAVDRNHTRHWRNDPVCPAMRTRIRAQSSEAPPPQARPPTGGASCVESIHLWAIDGSAFYVKLVSARASCCVARACAGLVGGGHPRRLRCRRRQRALGVLADPRDVLEHPHMDGV